MYWYTAASVCLFLSNSVCLSVVKEQWICWLAYRTTWVLACSGPRCPVVNSVDLSPVPIWHYSCHSLQYALDYWYDFYSSTTTTTTAAAAATNALLLTLLLHGSWYYNYYTWVLRPSNTATVTHRYTLRTSGTVTTLRLLLHCYCHYYCYIWVLSLIMKTFWYATLCIRCTTVIHLVM